MNVLLHMPCHSLDYLHTVTFVLNDLLPVIFMLLLTSLLVSKRYIFVDF